MSASQWSYYALGAGPLLVLWLAVEVHRIRYRRRVERRPGFLYPRVDRRRRDW